MSMFGAVDLSSFAPKQGGKTGGTVGPTASTGAAGPVVPGPALTDVDATNLRDIAEISTQVPVVLVLHSARSDSSGQLVELLEGLVGDYGGRFALGRVDIGTAPEVAQALQATAVPAVVALVAGQPVPMFQGAVPEEQLRSVLDQLLELAGANGVNGRVEVDEVQADESGPASAETEVERQAREAVERGDYTTAIGIYDSAIAQSPGDGELKIARAQIRMLSRMDGQDPQELLAAADAAGAGLDDQLAGADAALALGDVNAALGRALEAVRAHEGPQREEARVRLLELFDVIGSTSPEVARARRQLANLLF